MNYKGDLYGKQITVQFVRKVRDERRFSSADALIMQMERDVQEVDAILAKDPK